LNTIAVIGGTGLETLPPEWVVTPQVVETPFGTASVWDARRGEREILFVSRHGETHGLAPHQVNYRANIAALRQLGVHRVFATNAVGSLRLDLTPGSLVALDDFIDFTHNRPLSFWDDDPQSKIQNPKSKIAHTDFSEPYCPTLRAALLEAAAELDIPLLPRATYVCTNGPRFESPAEIRMFAQWGGDVIGMTGLPEAVFAREAGLCYAAVGIVTNFGAGLTPEKVDHAEVVAQMERQVEIVRELLLAAVGMAPDECSICAKP
jgi:5'-methylthioadenosine phosphorylase